MGAIVCSHGQYSSEMTDTEPITVEAELIEEDAEGDIDRAVTGRRSVARKYVKRLRKRHPEATPADIIRLLERHYGTAITAAGAAITVGVIAADVAIAMIPVAGPAAAGVKSAGQQAAKKAGTEAIKAAAKGVALGAAKSGAQRAAGLLPAGDQQLQFEITALFGLALAEIHGMDLDQAQAHALVYGLTNERVSQQQIATMAADVATLSSDGAMTMGQDIAAGRKDWSHWATTLADGMPAGAAQTFVRTIQTGQLEVARENLNGKQQSAIEYGAGALAGGVARFVFGRDVIAASHLAFAEPPADFPAHLTLPSAATSSAEVDTDEDAVEPNAAFAALEDAAKATGTWMASTAGTVANGVSAAAGSATRVFRSVDIDGDGIPDEPQALTVAKGLGSAVASATSNAGGRAADLFKRRKGERQPANS